MGDIFLGRIVKAFGIKGELKFHPSDDFWEAVLKSRRLKLHEESKEGRTTRGVEFIKVRPHGRSYVLAMKGVGDRNAAEAIVGAEMFIDDADIDVDMPEGALPFQLLGMTVKGEEGEELGELTSIVHSAAHDVYEVKNAQREFLVPAVPEFIVSVDLDDRTLVVRTIPGLTDEL